jgi:hypothetical protein
MAASRICSFFSARKKMVQDEEELSRADSSSSPWLSVVALFSAYRRCLGVHPQLPRGLKVFFST